MGDRMWEARAALGVLLVSAWSLSLVACTGGGLFGGDDEPYADMYNATGHVEQVPVRGRLIMEEEDDLRGSTTPLEQLSQDEIKNAQVQLALLVDGESIPLGQARTDDEGYLDVVMPVQEALEPGRYTLQVSYQGDVVGQAQVTLVGMERSDPVVRSDVDLTYLDTDFMSSAGLAGLVVQEAKDRRALPAMEVVYKELRGEQGRPVTFLSGSPRFFKRTLEGKMALDGVQQDGLVLKPFKDIVGANLESLDLDQIVPGLKEQIGYKLFWLLKMRSELPPGTPEILMGDDSEADVVVYVLYHRFLSQQLDAAGLVAELETLEVASFWLDAIEPLLPGINVTAQGEVAAIYINRTGVGDEHYPVADWSGAEGLVRHHSGAWPLALDLYEEGWVDEAGVNLVREQLTALGVTDAQRGDALAEADFLDEETLARFEP